jgi:hypothetical protein
MSEMQTKNFGNPNKKDGNLNKKYGNPNKKAFKLKKVFVDNIEQKFYRFLSH